MKITREQFLKLRQLCSKFKVSPEQIHLKKILRIDPRLFRRRFVLITVVGYRRHKCVLRYHQLKIVDLRSRLMNPPVRIVGKKKLTWRRSIRLLNKFKENIDDSVPAINAAAALRPDETSEDDSHGDQTSTPQLESHEVRSQIKTQLQLLQQGRRQAVQLTKDDPESKGKLAYGPSFDP